MAKKPEIATEEYRQACDEYLGWCEDCQEFTREQTEPDAYAYRCPECNAERVIGAENAMMIGAFDIVE